MEPEVDAAGTKRWRDEHGRLHRIGGPAVEFANGSRIWYWHGKRHRDGGPAVEFADGSGLWYWHGNYVSTAKHTARAVAAARKRTNLAVLALDAARRRKRRAVHLPAELWDALAEW